MTTLVISTAMLVRYINVHKRNTMFTNREQPAYMHRMLNSRNIA